MFTYFSSKEELLNELYIELKTEVHGRIHANFPHQAELYVRVRHIWTQYLGWAMEKPEQQKVSVLLNLSPMISAATRERMRAQQGAVSQTMDELGKHGAFKALPKGFASSAMLAMQEAVMEMVAKRPRQRTKLVELAFDAFWRMAV